LNAFAVPGGYVYIYTGLLKLMDSEAELAAVTSHEVSHVVARHSIKRLQQVLGVTVLYEIVMGQSSSETLEAAISAGLQIALQGYSRSYEREADEYGVHYLEKAGYNPLGAEEMFLKLKEASRESESRSFFENMLASHPETQERIDNVRAQAAAFPAEVRARDRGTERYRKMKALLP
jgi:predicted Zn-dependent protease